MLLQAVYALYRLQAQCVAIGRTPRLFQSLLAGESELLPPKSDNGSHGFYKTLVEADCEQHTAIIVNTVRQAVAKTLGFMSPADVDIDRPLKDIGLDSLSSILIRNNLAGPDWLGNPC